MNLIPNIYIMAIQLVVFLINIYIVKVFILEPFLRLKARRDEATSLLKNKTHLLAEENKKSISDIELAIQEVREYNRNVMETAKNKQQTENQNQIMQIKEEANARLAAFKQELEAQVKEQQSKVQSTVRELSKELHSKLLS